MHLVCCVVLPITNTSLIRICVRAHTHEHTRTLFTTICWTNGHLGGRLCHQQVFCWIMADARWRWDREEGREGERIGRELISHRRLQFVHSGIGGCLYFPCSPSRNGFQIYQECKWVELRRLLSPSFYSFIMSTVVTTNHLH